MKKIEIIKETIVLESETRHYHFNNHIKHGMKRKKFTRDEILNMIHINHALEINMQMTWSNMKSN